MSYKTKSVNFNLDDQRDHELFESLKKLGHGDFSETTKQMWLQKLNNGKKEASKLFEEGGIIK